MTSPTEKRLVATIEVVGEPVGQPKHAQVAMPVRGTRCLCLCGCYKRWRAMAYPVKTVGEGSKKRPHPIVAWRKAIREAVRRAWQGRVTLFGPVCVDCHFRFRRPNTHFGTGRNEGKLKPNAPVFQDTKPDRDNADKPVLDALEAAGVLSNDSRVSDGRILKMFCNDGEQPGLTITIWTLED